MKLLQATSIASKMFRCQLTPVTALCVLQCRGTLIPKIPELPAECDTCLFAVSPLETSPRPTLARCQSTEKIKRPVCLNSGRRLMRNPKLLTRSESTRAPEGGFAGSGASALLDARAVDGRNTDVGTMRTELELEPGCEECLGVGRSFGVVANSALRRDSLWRWRNHRSTPDLKSVSSKVWDDRSCRLFNFRFRRH